MKYIHNSDKDQKKPAKYTAEPVKKYTEIETPAGQALIAPGNYVMTDPDGNKFGITQSDLDSLYTTVK